MNKQFYDVHASDDGVFNTQSGLLVDINNPTADMINTGDIAHALSNTCRFNGHTSDFYSVAQHSLLVAVLAPKELRLEALLHDASEAYLGDVIKPLKNILGKTYTDLEDRFMEVIINKYGLDKQKLDSIKAYDKEALELEHDVFFKNSVGSCNKLLHLMKGRYKFFPTGDMAKMVLMTEIKKITKLLPC